MESSPSVEVSTRLVNETLPAFMETEGVQKSTPLDPLLNQLNLVHTFPASFF